MHFDCLCAKTNQILQHSHTSNQDRQSSARKLTDYMISDKLHQKHALDAAKCSKADVAGKDAADAVCTKYPSAQRPTVW